MRQADALHQAVIRQEVIIDILLCLANGKTGEKATEILVAAIGTGGFGHLREASYI